MKDKNYLKKYQKSAYSDGEDRNMEKQAEEMKNLEIHMERYLEYRAQLEEKAYNYIEKKLHPGESVIHLLPMENMYSKMAQSGVAIAYGLGNLPFLNMQLNAILIMTNIRLFVCMLDGADFETATLREYELKEISEIKTAIDGHMEYLYIFTKQGGKRAADFVLCYPGYDYGNMFKPFLLSVLKKNSVIVTLRDEKIEKKNKNNYRNMWIGMGIVCLYISIYWIVFR